MLWNLPLCSVCLCYLPGKGDGCCGTYHSVVDACVTYRVEVMDVVELATLRVSSGRTPRKIAL